MILSEINEVLKVVSQFQVLKLEWDCIYIILESFLFYSKLCLLVFGNILQFENNYIIYRKSAPAEKQKKKKEGRRWDNGGTKADEALLDFSKPNEKELSMNGVSEPDDKPKSKDEQAFLVKNVNVFKIKLIRKNIKMFNNLLKKDIVGQMKGELKGFDSAESSEEEFYEEEIRQVKTKPR